MAQKSIYIALFCQTPEGPKEPVAKAGYCRVKIDLDPTMWDGAIHSTFPMAWEDWGTCCGWGLFREPSGGASIRLDLPIKILPIQPIQQHCEIRVGSKLELNVTLFGTVSPSEALQALFGPNGPTRTAWEILMDEDV